MRRFGAGLAVVASAVLIAGCGSGGGDTTTVIREPAPAVERTTTVQAPRANAKPAASTSSSKPKAVPNIVGLPLDVAEELLEEDGYRAAATNTDTAFGIIDPSNYTVCTQDDARGPIVPLLAQKYGC